MRQRALLCFLQIAEQGTSSRHSQRLSFHAEARKIAGTEEADELPLCRLMVEMPGGAAAQSGQLCHEARPGHIVAYQRFCWSKPREFRGQRFCVGRFAQ